MWTRKGWEAQYHPFPHLTLQCIQHLDSFGPVAGLAVHVDQDVVGDQIGGAPLSQQLAVHVDRQIQLIGLPGVGVISAGSLERGARSIAINIFGTHMPAFCFAGSLVLYLICAYGTLKKADCFCFSSITPSIIIAASGYRIKMALVKVVQ
jgi:hypothetical protein